MKQQNQNRRIYVKFTLTMVCCAILGAFCGAFASANNASIADLLSTSSEFIYKNNFAIVLINLIFLWAGTLFAMSGKKHAKQALQDDFAFEKANKHLCISLILSTLSFIWWFFSLSLTAVSIFQGVVLSHFVLACLLIAEICWVTALQSVCVSVTKQINPEKNGNIFDMKFHEKWYNSCDEAERAQIGECSYFSFRIMTMVYPVAIVLLIFAGTVSSINATLLLGLSVLWGIQHLSYQIRSFQISYLKK